MFTRLFTLLFSQPPETFLHGKFVFAGHLPGEVRLVFFLGAVGLVWLLYRAHGRPHLPLDLSHDPGAADRPGLPAGLRSRRADAASRDAEEGQLSLRPCWSTPRNRCPLPDVAGAGYPLAGGGAPSGAPSTLGRGQGRGEPISRIQAATDVLFAAGKETGLVPAISDDSRVILYSFSDNVKRADRRELAAAQGSFTNIFRAVRNVDAELRAVPLAAMVLVTDGCRNSGGSTSDAARILQARGVPLYVLGVGDPRPPESLEVVEVAAPRQVRRDTEVELDVTVKHSGIVKPLDVVLKRGDEVLLTRRFTPNAESDVRSRVRLMFTPDFEGTSTYRVEIRAQGARSGSREQGAGSRERWPLLPAPCSLLPPTAISSWRSRTTGSPCCISKAARGWSTVSLRRALFRDKSFRLVGMLRLAPGRFYIQGANDSEGYLKEGFPDTAERLAAFQAIILGDIEAKMFTAKQMQLLEDFVKRRGGGLLMLGGVNSFGLGGYAKTPVGDMLPVTISPADPAYSDEQFAARTIAENLQHPVMRLAPTRRRTRSSGTTRRR